MRGFLGGVSAGALLAAGGLAMLSLSVPLPKPGPLSAADAAQEDGSAPQEAAPRVAETETDGVIAEPAPNPVAEVAPQPMEHEPGELPTLADGAEAVADAPASGAFRDADLAGAQPTTPATADPADDLSALEDADRNPAVRPEVGQTAAAADAPDVSTEGLALADGAGSVEHQPTPLQPGQPQAPGSEDAVVAATEPAPAPAPEETTDDVAEETAEVDRPDVAPVDDSAVIAGLPSQSALEVPDIGPAPQATTLPVIGAAPVLPDSKVEETPEETQNDQAEQDDLATDTDQAALAPQIGTPVVPLTERDDPQNAAALGENSGERPFVAHAEPFENLEGKPLMSIVLIEDIGSVGVEALAEFPYPLSFAINPQDPQAQEKMAARRAAGFEVLMLADLPREATPQDAETALEVWRRQLPEAVAILEGVESGVQGNRPLADQVAAVAGSVGYGLVTQNSGLNTVQKLALRDGVPAGVVFRDFDGAGQDPRAIRRFLDQAAFRAGQEGAVIMLGRLRADTISALLTWGLQDRAGRVALAPVSASLEAKLPSK